MEEKKFDPYQFTGVFLIALILTWMLFNNDNTQEIPESNQDSDKTSKVSDFKNLPLNITQTKLKVIKLQKKNSKKPVRLITFFQMKRERLTTTSLDMLLLRAVVEVVKDLVVLIRHPFQIFLRTSSAILVVVDQLEDQATEEMT